MKTTKTTEKDIKKEPKKEKPKAVKVAKVVDDKKPVKKEVKKDTKKEVKKPVKKEVKDEVKDEVKEETKDEKDLKSDRYMESTGKRKRAIARVRVFTKGKKEILINGKPCKDYFYTLELEQTATDSLRKMKSLDKFRVLAIVRGGGISAQAEAVRHGIAKILVDFNPDFRKRLRKAGFLTRDPRKRERKKFGLKRARRAPQWAKR